MIREYVRIFDVTGSYVDTDSLTLVDFEQSAAVYENRRVGSQDRHLRGNGTFLRVRNKKTAMDVSIRMDSIVRVHALSEETD